MFANVSWGRWLALMIPYSVFFFLIDSLVVWRVINWFNARVRYVDILPIRGSTYILSILNEQIGKGVMAFYLNRRDRVPGWQVGSSMLFSSAAGSASSPSGRCFGPFGRLPVSNSDMITPSA